MVRKTPENYERLNLAVGQRHTVEDLTKAMSEESGLDEIVLRGFFWQSCKKWQRESRHLTSEAAEMPPRERQRIVEGIFDDFSQLVEAILASDEERMAFRLASRTGFKRWKRKYTQGPDTSEG